MMWQPGDLWNTPSRQTRCPADCTCGRHRRLTAKTGYKGSAAGKHARHRRIHIRRGKASQHLCAHCAEFNSPEPAREWAQIHETSGNDPWADFMPLCRRCHFRYDGLKLGGDTSMFKRCQ
jgi:hypothetical protein